jgi:Rod binding domain-containing protein
MIPTSIDNKPLHAVTPADKQRQHAEKVASQFEEVFVRTMVGSLRQTSSIGGDGGGMFGAGPGADTYGDWFDQNLAEQISRTSHIGIREQLLADFEHNGELAHRQKAVAAAAQKAVEAVTASRHDNLINAHTLGTGGADVVL